MIANNGCKQEGKKQGFLKPILSAKLRSFKGIKYGKVEIIAKLPRGDWLWPGKSYRWFIHNCMKQRGWYIPTLPYFKKLVRLFLLGFILFLTRTTQLQTTKCYLVINGKYQINYLQSNKIYETTENNKKKQWKIMIICAKFCTHLLQLCGCCQTINQDMVEASTETGHSLVRLISWRRGEIDNWARWE